MIHLDTNYLIGLQVKGSAVALDVDGLLATGESFAASAIAWTEFLNGPVTPLAVSRAEAVLAVTMQSTRGGRHKTRGQREGSAAFRACVKNIF